MKSKIFALSILLAVSSASYADTTGFLTLKSGVSNVKFEPSGASDFSDTVANLSFGGGINFREDVIGGRVELEWMHYFKAEGNIHRHWQDVKSELNLDTLMVNGYLDLYPAEWVNFYLTAGAGTRWSKLKMCNGYCVSDRDTGGTFKAGAGIMFNINKNFSIDIGYRYAALSSDVHSHNAQAGFQFNF
jgi:opacity protein-like surface antigen